MEKENRRVIIEKLDGEPLEEIIVSFDEAQEVAVLLVEMQNREV